MRAAGAASAASFSPPAGAFDPTVTAAQTCSRGFTRTQRERDTYQMRDRVYTRYGVARGHRAGLYVIDHLIPISLGGLTTETNLWPQTRAEVRARIKTSTGYTMPCAPAG